MALSEARPSMVSGSFRQKRGQQDAPAALSKWLTSLGTGCAEPRSRFPNSEELPATFTDYHQRHVGAFDDGRLASVGSPRPRKVVRDLKHVAGGSEGGRPSHGPVGQEFRGDDRQVVVLILVELAGVVDARNGVFQIVEIDRGGGIEPEVETEGAGGGSDRFCVIGSCRPLLGPATAAGIGIGPTEGVGDAVLLAVLLQSFELQGGGRIYVTRRDNHGQSGFSSEIRLLVNSAVRRLSESASGFWAGHRPRLAACALCLLDLTTRGTLFPEGGESVMKLKLNWFYLL